jgi:hypothetical protein
MAQKCRFSQASWRRQFYGDLAHGVKIFDLFELVTSISVRHFRK